MMYQSTRSKSTEMYSMDIIKQGISPEGGLFVPKEIPTLTENELVDMISMNYQQRATRILSKFLTDYSESDLRDCVNAAYRKDNFDSHAIAPVEKLSSNLFIQELWHGPTCAFKDMALQILPHLMTTAVKATGEKNEIVILVATSGDTGKAALEGFMNVEGTRIMVFYPEKGVSSIQRLQMITQEGNNVSTVAVKGNFDDTQTGVKSIFTDASFKQVMKHNGYQFSSANSINWGRLVPQIVYYISAYVDMVSNGWVKKGESFNVVVPTGNFGNILAAYYAKAMGLPVGRLICASNSNNVLTDFINTGTYDRKREFYQTISPSMDILISSNLERLLFELADKDDEAVVRLMNDLRKCGAYSLDAGSVEKLQALFWGGYATEEQTLKAIQETYNRFDYVMDPHTAVGKCVYDQYRRETGDDTKTLLISTASPFKFAGDVLKAVIGTGSIIDKDEFKLLEILSNVSHQAIPQSLKVLKNKELLHREACSREDMSKMVVKFLELDEVQK
jgi:threonine synthase